MNSEYSDAVMDVREATSRRPSRLAAGVSGLVTLIALSVAVQMVSDSDSSYRTLGDIAQLVIWAPLFLWLGTLIVFKQVNDRMGWLLISIGSGFAASSVVDLMASRLGPITAVANVVDWLVLWALAWAWMLWVFPILLLFYVFPTGTLLSRRWRWAPVALFVVAASSIVMSSFGSTLETYDPEPFTQGSVANPIGFFPDSAGAVAAIPWVAALFVTVIGGGVAMVVRYRRADRTERAQINWVLFDAFALLVGLVVSVATNGWAPANFVATAGVVLLPVVITVAILKFRLYDIDVVISKSLTFGVLVVFIGAVYVGIVVGVGELLGRDSSFGLSVAATAVVAIAFQPVRGRVERWANRVVYGKRATPYEVMARFSRRASEDDDDVLSRIPQMIVDGTGASDATLWVRSSDGFRSASVWPESDAVQVLGWGDEFEDPDADLSLPVVHDGELLGGISLVAARGGMITPPEQELVTNLAEGMGLTLRNSQLTAALRRQVTELQRSRDRVVSAADDARRSLEHDLDSGPQQHLVAVKVKLGPLHKLAQQAGAVKAASMLFELEAQAGDSIQAVRDFAAGIYPPLLGAEGLAVALGQETKRAAVPVEIEADGVGRYPRSVESAVYFSILEALQNSAKYAQASQAVVRLDQLNGALVFEVSDNGRGFDPSTVERGAGLDGIGDRIDIIGGTWTITSQPGHGTTVTGSIPITDR